MIRRPGAHSARARSKRTWLAAGAGRDMTAADRDEIARRGDLRAAANDRARESPLWPADQRIPPCSGAHDRTGSMRG